MLEAAAKAAGRVFHWDGHVLVLDDYCSPDECSAWNPLTDDGDALRLAVKLQLQITPGTYNKDEFTAFRAAAGEAHERYSYLQDEYAATRRAIVRAAASLTPKEAP